MNILTRKPREKDRRDIAFDARPKHLIDPEMQAIDRMVDSLRDPLLQPFKPESEVMPLVSEQRTRNDDARPPSATEADQDDFSNDPFPLSRLDEIALLVDSLTYGEMMELAAALWKMRPEGKEVTEQELPGMLHRWSAAGSGA